MTILIHILFFIAAILILSWLSSRLVVALVGLAKYLRWREFIVAFFVMAFAGSLPNLFVDVNAALQGMPEISLGDILGGNFVDLTLALALAVLFSVGSLPAESEMVQKTAIFTSGIALLPLLLIWDGRLDRIDGIVLIFAFFVYVLWLFSKEERFKKVYKKERKKKSDKKPILWLEIGKVLFFLAILLGMSFFIIESVQFFSEAFGISLSMVGILILGLANCFPETYFSIVSARKGEGWMVLGDLMGSVIVAATLVLGIVILICPFEIKDFSPFLMTRMFTVVASLIFLVFIRTGKKITKLEGLLFLSIYILFILVEVFVPYFIN